MLWRLLRLRRALMATAPAPTTREQLLVRLRRAEGQLRGVQRMLDEGADCREVLTQLSAVKAALDQVGLHLITDEMRTCVAAGEGDCVQKFEDAVATFLRFATLAR
jgi:CsoR family transcriptional regulator, copper-sensing transcriptional repressor